MDAAQDTFEFIGLFFKGQPDCVLLQGYNGDFYPVVAFQHILKCDSYFIGKICGGDGTERFIHAGAWKVQRC